MTFEVELYFGDNDEVTGSGAHIEQQLVSNHGGQLCEKPLNMHLLLHL